MPCLAVPTTPKGRRTWQQLLEAARAVFARDGYVNARMADIAEEAGLSMGALYRYFENKESVFRTPRDRHPRGALSLPAGPATITSPPNPSRWRFARRTLGYLRHYFEHRDVMRTLVEAAAVGPAVQGDLVEDAHTALRSAHLRRFEITSVSPPSTVSTRRWLRMR